MLPPEFLAQANNVFSSGSYTEIIRYRAIAEVPFILAFLIFIIPKTLAMFLIGMIAGKLNIFGDIEGNRDLINRTWRLTGLLGVLALTGKLIMGYSEMASGFLMLSSILYGMFSELGTVLVSLFYITSVIKLLQSATFARILLPLQAVGRMALTNYLVQCIVCSLVFYGHGFGYIGRISMFGGVVFTVVFFALQTVLSNVWFRYYKFGPFERLWRNYTYGKYKTGVQHTA